MKKKVVVGQSGISAGQQQDFWRKVDDGTIDGNVFGYFLDHVAEIRRVALGSDLVTEARALAILGESRFLSAGRVIPAWNRAIQEKRTAELPLLEAPGSTVIRYSEQTLREAAQDVAWHLVWNPGLSLRNNRAIFGVNTEQQPCHYKDNTWWLGPKEDGWATEKGETGYYLLRMEGLFAGQTWDDQEAEISRMGMEFYRSPSRLITNACFSIFLLTGRRPLETYYHWGPEAVSGGRLVRVGSFGCGGFFVYDWLRVGRSGRIRVCLARKFQN